MSPTPPPFFRCDFTSSPHPQGGLWFGDFEQLISTNNPVDVLACLEQIAGAVEQGYYAAGFMAYEAAAGLNDAFCTHPPDAGLPLLWFGLCRQPATSPPDLPSDAGYHLGEWQPCMSRAKYDAAYRRIMGQITAGNSYQVNFTFPLHTRFHSPNGSRMAATGSLYHHLRRAQAANYCAWLHTPEFDLLSVSPELFFELRDGLLTTRPMKGTRSRGMTLAEDNARRDELRHSPKDRAENVMIVDLLRNDLGQVAEFGTVQVPSLFDAERYPTVWQLTSTVQARLRASVGPVDVLRALFPCGSITGAPKASTMQIIARNESGPRGAYCGTLGYITPGGEAVFNVAIRTLTLLPDGRARYHVGSGLVADSHSVGEYEECLLKARVLAAAADPWPEFQLLESLLYRPETGLYLLARHLTRLQDSAAYFGFACDVAAIRAQLLAASDGWDAAGKIRLLLAKDGTAIVEHMPLEPPGFRLPRTVTLAAEPVSSRDPFVYHKTTHRAIYTRAQAARGDADTVLLYNQRGELTESVSANLAVQMEGQWWTPPVGCGLLAGTLRAELLAQGELRERVIHRDELGRATGIRLLNSVRGVFDVVLVGAS